MYLDLRFCNTVTKDKHIQTSSVYSILLLIISSQLIELHLTATREEVAIVLFQPPLVYISRHLKR